MCRGIAKTRKFETFDKHSQKEGARGPGNCKTTSVQASTFIMSALNVTSFGNRPARRAGLSGIPSSPSFSRTPILRYSTMPSSAYWRFRGVEFLSTRQIVFSRRIFYKLGHFAGRFIVQFARSLQRLDLQYHT